MPHKRTIPISKTCPTCKKVFLVCPPGRTSRTYPSNSQVFCTHPCALKARYRSGRKCKELLPTQAAYIAGFLDADGCIMMYARRDSVAMRVTFSNTKKDVLQWIADTTGIGGYASHPETHKHSRSWTLQANAEAAETLLIQVRPYLIRKRKQADLAMDFQKRLRDPALNADKSWQQEYRAKMQWLNRKGPNP